MGKGGEVKPFSELTKFRKRHPMLGWGDSEGGFFTVVSPVQKNKDFRIIASIGGGWDHVSVSLEHRCPTWMEMDFIKRIFFNSDEIVMQIHPEEKDHINVMPFCLHLWRPQNEVIPLPPKWMVA